MEDQLSGQNTWRVGTKSIFKSNLQPAKGIHSKWQLNPQSTEALLKT